MPPPEVPLVWGWAGRLVGGHRPCAPGRRARWSEAAPDQEAASALPPPETFPPDEITSPAGEQAPIVRSWGLRERTSFRPLKIAALRFMNRHGLGRPASAQQQHSPATLSPDHSLSVTGWRSAGPAQQGSHTPPLPQPPPRHPPHPANTPGSALPFPSAARASVDDLLYGPHPDF